jgi:GNAT superfamily N-acetyltransferase
MSDGYHIRVACVPDDMARVAHLMRVYIASLGIDLTSHGFEKELAILPGAYCPPRGALLVLDHPEQGIVGCVALRELDQPGACEMKRMYIEPHARGGGNGRRLAEAIIAEARHLGHLEMFLDTLPKLTTAIALYGSLGFRPTTPYAPQHPDGAVFFRLGLA